MPVLGQALEGEARATGKHTTRVPGRLVVPALGPWIRANLPGPSGHSGPVRRLCSAAMAVGC